jgi:hypothetical protein
MARSAVLVPLEHMHQKNGYSRRKVNFMSTLCPATYAVHKAQNGIEEVVPFFCKQWSCGRCRQSVSKLWAHKVYVAFNAKTMSASIKGDKSPIWFITLTMPRGWHKSDRVSKAHYDYLHDKWRKVVKECQKKYHNFAYVAVLEAHKTGVPHLHILMTRPLPTKNQPRASKHELHDYAVSHGFGYMVDQQRVNSRRAASYVAKYLTKGGHLLHKGARRVWATHKLFPEAKGSGGAWIARERGQDWVEWAARVDAETDMPAQEALADVEDLMSDFPEGIQRSGLNALLT